MNMMTHWNPFREMDDFFKSFNRFPTRTQTQEGLLSTDWTPSVDITESDEEFLIKAELPEVKKEDISISVDNGVLTLSGERRSETKDEKDCFGNDRGADAWDGRCGGRTGSEKGQTRLQQVQGLPRP